VPLPNDWNPAHEAVWRENAPGTTRAINLRHPTYPYEGPDQGALPDDQSDTLIDFAATYLRKVSSALGLTATFGVSDIFQPGSSQFIDTVRLVWLPVFAAESIPAPPVSSFWVNRYESPENYTSRVDRTAVILAVQSAKANDLTQVLGSRLGIRIVAHVAPSTSGPVKAQITGASCSIGLSGALALHARAASHFFRDFFAHDRTRSDVKAQVREMAGFGDYNLIFYDGLRVIGASGARAIVDVYMTVLPRPEEPEALAHAVEAKFLVGGRDAPELGKLEKWPLVAHAGPVLAKVFTQDPASKAGLGRLIDSRPNRSPQRLMTYFDTRTLAGVTLGTFFETHLLDNANEVEVMQSKLVDPSANEGAEQVVAPLCVTHPRLNWFAAISAYQHARGLESSVGLAPPGLLDTMRAYGLLPAQYFRFASLPLHVRHRAPINHGGKDGKVVNAQVNFEGLKGDVIATTQTAPALPLQLKFALADTKRTASRRQPLGIAADPRWCWHEGGHVLLAASTGALQFRFAHSPGDALAAVLSDPDSMLATHPQMRGLTFPWVYLHRRHDRDVFRGWSWSGRYHRPARFTTDVNSYRRKGYQSEQILSTSLFRLYRALGGDTTVAGGAPDRVRRRAAADYTAYLIMKAIRLMPPALLAPLETPDQFVSALIDADISTLLTTASGPLQGRVGGWAHKVVRGAFEAQGLYATTNPLAVVDAPGEPPDPDVFIDDLRSDSEGHYPRGGYMPVSLDWKAGPPDPQNPPTTPVVPPHPPNPPLWHATADAIRVVGDTVTTVEVSTRGPSTASQVTVEVWWTDWPLTQTDPPLWNDGSWTSLGTSASQTVAPWPARTTFGPFPASGSGVAPLPTSPSGRRLLIIATATCAADRANTDIFTALPCSTSRTPIVDLVAGDNNLGLRRHDIP
jgi:hypothetical protein